MESAYTMVADLKPIDGPMMKLMSEGSLGVGFPQVGDLTARRRIGLSEPGVVVSGLTGVLGAGPLKEQCAL